MMLYYSFICLSTTYLLKFFDKISSNAKVAAPFFRAIECNNASCPLEGIYKSYPPDETELAVSAASEQTLGSPTPTVQQSST